MLLAHRYNSTGNNLTVCLDYHHITSGISMEEHKPTRAMYIWIITRNINTECKTCKTALHPPTLLVTLIILISNTFYWISMSLLWLNDFRTFISSSMSCAILWHTENRSCNHIVRAQQTTILSWINHHITTHFLRKCACNCVLTSNNMKLMLTGIYSGENKYLNPCRFRKFGHLQRNVWSIIVMVGLF